MNLIEYRYGMSNIFNRVSSDYVLNLKNRLKINPLKTIIYESYANVLKNLNLYQKYQSDIVLNKRFNILYSNTKRKYYNHKSLNDCFLCVISRDYLEIECLPPR